jgi:protein disulfide-isomerase
MTWIQYARGVLLVALGLLTSSCGQSNTSQLTAAAPASQAKEIDWFKGTFEQASMVAAQMNRPMLLYWGAKWCPYCQALRKTVFVRPDFIEKSALFVPVYMDADLPEVQAWIKPLGISGYPTLQITKADHTELARLSGGMDLSLYAGLFSTFFIISTVHRNAIVLPIIAGIRPRLRTSMRRHWRRYSRRPPSIAAVRTRCA